MNINKTIKLGKVKIATFILILVVILVGIPATAAMSASGNAPASPQRSTAHYTQSNDESSVQLDDAAQVVRVNDATTVPAPQVTVTPVTIEDNTESVPVDIGTAVSISR